MGYQTHAPLEIVSKVILRHANISTTQRYLGKVSDTEAVQMDLEYPQTKNARGNELILPRPMNCKDIPENLTFGLLPGHNARCNQHRNTRDKLLK